MKKTKKPAKKTDAAEQSRLYRERFHKLLDNLLDAGDLMHIAAIGFLLSTFEEKEGAA